MTPRMSTCSAGASPRTRATETWPRWTARRRFGPWRMKLVDGRPYPHLTGLFGYGSLRKAGALALERRMALLARL